MRRTLLIAVATIVSFVTLVQPSALAATGRAVRITRTSSWSPPSPDPAGITYMKSTGRLLVSDPEVDETSLWHKRNIFEATTHGALKRAGRVKPPSTDPEDVAWDNDAGVLYVVDDDADRVFRFNPGRDGKLGTADDSISTVLHNQDFGSHDGQGIAYRVKDQSLFIADSKSGRIYHVKRGRDGDWGTRDDVVTSFGTGALGVRYPEGVAYDARSQHLFIVDGRDPLIAEATAAGSLVRKISIAGSGIVRPSGITFAPASGDPTKTHIYVTDRGADNNSRPGENDGRIFEFSVRR
jgi:DNA-binding beta-propeller fold protein YncE